MGPVCVVADYDTLRFNDDERYVEVFAKVFPIPKWWWQLRPPVVSGSIWFHLHRTDRLRLLAGQIDANDPSRFTVPFEWNGARGEIEGAVASGAQVRLKVVSGPACESPEPDWAYWKHQWEATTRPTTSVSFSN